MSTDRLHTALDHHQAGRLAAALAIYQDMLAEQPASADALHWSGVIAQQQGDPARAVELIAAALRHRPNYAEAHYNLGHAYQSLGQTGQALASYAQAIRYKPDFAEAYCSLGNMLKAQGQLEAAAMRYRQAISFKLAFVDAHNNLGNTLRALGQNDEAVACFRNALHFKPDARDVLNNLAVALLEQKNYLPAGDCLLQALQIDPSFAEAHVNLGGVYQALGRVDAAIASLQQAVALDPGLAGAHNNLGLLYRKRGRQPDALRHFRQALAIRPDFAEAAYNYHDVQLNCCYWQDYAAHVARINADVHRGLGRYLPFAFLAVSRSPAHELDCARQYAREFFPAASLPLWQGEPYAHRRLRIAYLSADFHNHATAYLMAGLFEAHDKERFEVMAVSFGPPSQCDMRQRLVRAFDRFVDVRDLGDFQVAALLREWETDIAVDLKGYTTEGRPGILAHRPAPLQISYLGYPGTLGCDYLDYIVADRCVLPPEEQVYYTEQVIYLPDSYQVNDDRRRIAERRPSREEVGLPETGFVFCCFNNNYKINPPLFDLWMRLLLEVPDSVLWLFANNPLVVDNLRAEAARRGVAAERLVFAQAVPLPEHLARIGLGDLFLDTLPYNAHTTASDALWAGVPVLTCKGNTFAGRVAASLLQALGMPELITESREAYAELARRIATTPALHAELRAKLARQRVGAPLFDTDRFRRHLEAAYLAADGRLRQGLAPGHLDVPPLS